MRDFFLNKNIKSNIKLTMREKDKLIQCKEKIKGINHKNAVEVHFPFLNQNNKYETNQVAKLIPGPRQTAEIDKSIFNTVDSLERTLEYSNLLSIA